MTIMYGIPNCDTIKKAKKFLTDNNIAFNFHDYRKNGLDETLLDTFFSQLGWENVLNKRGTTYRALTEEQKQTLNEHTAKALLLEAPAMIKRPILIHNDKYYLGFKKEQYQEIFSL
ncbi:ArsC family reductase [Pseudoalteromonas sp. JBTF-M23]|uniref:ArsC family reductase n=1 Tax=Pseudoalteromonas caenipelagi TaxID=2726988 RepID=A0A849VAE8_9GAMM|nr:ArsC family reductase [Pseudoalteromonas caenipelagi]NOU48954.1 ArsC family reductase [Pseudoalteromonas caenipelagi]